MSCRSHISSVVMPGMFDIPVLLSTAAVVEVNISSNVMVINHNHRNRNAIMTSTKVTAD